MGITHSSVPLGVPFVRAMPLCFHVIRAVLDLLRLEHPVRHQGVASVASGFDLLFGDSVPMRSPDVVPDVGWQVPLLAVQGGVEQGAG